MAKLKKAAGPKTGRHVTGVPRAVLRFEGAGLAIAAAIAFAHLGHSWWWFALLIMLPDLSLVGYLFGTQPGAILYDSCHSTLGPALLALTGYLGDHSLACAFAAIWISHIGIERLLGLGLRYATGFTHTHLGTINQTKLQGAVKVN